MSLDTIRQAAQVLRTYLAATGQPDRAQQTSAIASLVYASRLNEPPIYPGDSDALDQVCDRYGDILTDYLALSAVILADAAADHRTTTTALLDHIVDRHLNGYT